MGGVNLDDVETGAIGADGGGAKGLDDGSDAGVVQLMRLRIVGREGDGRGSENVGPAAVVGGLHAFAAPRAIGARLAAGVGKLNAGVRALGAQESRNAGERRDVLVLPEAQILEADAAFGSDGRGLSEDQASATDGAAAEVDKMPVIGKAVLAGVLAHGRDDDAVGKGDGANLQRGKKVCRDLGCHAAVWMNLVSHRVQATASWEKAAAAWRLELAGEGSSIRPDPLGKKREASLGTKPLRRAGDAGEGWSWVCLRGNPSP